MLLLLFLAKGGWRGVQGDAVALGYGSSQCMPCNTSWQLGWRGHLLAAQSQQQACAVATAAPTAVAPCCAGT